VRFAISARLLSNVKVNLLISIILVGHPFSVAELPAFVAVTTTAE